jgi:predicted MFS family arabinose efflux permease
MGVLRHRQFRLLFVGQLVSLLGDGVFVVALSFAVLSETDSEAALGIVLAAGSLPLVAFVLVGGVWADRLSRRRVMLAADGVRMVVQGVLAGLVLAGHAPVGAFVVLYGVYGVAMAFFSPASTGLVPETLPAAELQRANGLLAMTRSVTGIVGAALGGVLVAVLGAGTAIAVDSLSFAVSVLALASMRTYPPSREDEPRAFRQKLSVGWREVRSRRWVWMTILNASLFLMLYVAPFDVLGPIVSRDSLGGALSWGLISASFAAGMALGGVLLMRTTLRRPMVVAGSIFLVTSLSPLLLAIAAPVALICAAYAADGVGAGIFLTTWDTALQRDIPEHVLSRVSAWDWMGSLAGMPLGFALTGPLLALVGVNATLYGMAACASALTVWMLAARDIRQIGERRPDTVAA